MVKIPTEVNVSIGTVRNTPRVTKMITRQITQQKNEMIAVDLVLDKDRLKADDTSRRLRSKNVSTIFPSANRFEESIC